MKMKIYDRAGAPNTARIRIVLAAKGLEKEVEFVSVDLIDAQQKSDAYLAKNPIGKIPLLELEDGTVISESTAITEYLDNLDGKPVLTGRSPREKGLIHMMQRRVEQLVMEPFDDFFHYGTRGLGEALTPWRMPEWAGRKEWGERRGAMAARNLPYFDAILEKQSYLAVDRFSLPDITLYAFLLFTDILSFPVPAELKGLAAWRARIEALPAVRDRGGKDILPEDLARFAA
jgi:glutathione S-transferase